MSIDKLTYRVIAGDRTLSGPMNIADAHNYALTVDEQEQLVEVVETFEYGCCKCGDDYYTLIEQNRPTGRWRCGACTWSLL